MNQFKIIEAFECKQCGKLTKHENRLLDHMKKCKFKESIIEGQVSLFGQSSQQHKNHYAKVPKDHEGRKIKALCGYRALLKETTTDFQAVNCFICKNRLPGTEKESELTA